MTVPMMYHSKYPLRPIPVIDRVARTLRLRPAQQALWRAAVADVLASWSETGLTFELEEGLRATNTKERHFYREYALPGAIQLVQMSGKHPSAPDNPLGFAYVDTFTNPSATGGVAVINRRAVRTSGSRRLRWGIGHEIGHCLGLAHNDGGIMRTGSGPSQPSAEEIDTLHDYYFA